MSDIRVLPDRELSDMEKALELVKKEYDVYIEFQRIQAKITGAKYKALIEEGFSEDQALELCKEQ